MKADYVTPEFQVLKYQLSKDVLATSIPENTLPGQGTIEEPGNPSDEF